MNHANVAFLESRLPNSGNDGPTFTYYTVKPMPVKASRSFPNTRPIVPADIPGGGP